jgi:hypothetical protein
MPKNAKKKVGRPSKPAGKARYRRLKVSVNAQEQAQIERAAEAVGLSVSAWVRMQVLKAAVDVPEPLVTRVEMHAVDPLAVLGIARGLKQVAK